MSAACVLCGGQLSEWAEIDDTYRCVSCGQRQRKGKRLLGVRVMINGRDVVFTADDLTLIFEGEK